MLVGKGVIVSPGLSGPSVTSGKRKLSMVHGYRSVTGTKRYRSILVPSGLVHSVRVLHGS